MKKSYKQLPNILIPADYYEYLGEKLKPLFNAAGYWIVSADLPASANGAKAPVAALFHERHLNLVGKRGHKGWIGKSFEYKGVKYVVFPDMSESVDEDAFAQSVSHLSAKAIPQDLIRVISNNKELATAISVIKRMPYVVCDFETRGLDPFTEEASILTLAAGNSDVAFVMPMSHPQSPFLGITALQQEWIEAVYLVPKLVAFNAKYELRWFQALGYPIRDVAFDPMIAHHMLYEWMAHDLDTLSAAYTDYAGYSAELSGALADKKDYSTAPLDVLCRYNGMDVIATDLVTKALTTEIADTGRLRFVLEQLDLPLVSLLAEMEHNGMFVNTDRLTWLQGWYDKEISNLSQNVMAQKSCKSYFDEHPDFNFNSPIQMRDLLFNYLKFKPRKFTEPSKTYPQGVPSVDKEAMSQLMKTGKHLPVLGAIMKRTRATKIKTSFLDVFEKRTVDGILRTNYNQHVVETFRLSSSNPNLQNLPRSEDLESAGLEPPKMVFASRFDKGWIIQSDFSQLELRVAAMYAKDKTFVTAFNEGRDLHGEMAQLVYGEGYTKEQRYKAKRTNFSAVFDVGPESLAEQTGSTVEEAKKLLQTFRSLHPELFQWFDKIWKEAQYQGYVENFLGRQRHIKWEMSQAKSDHEADAVRRSVYNFPIQSSAADMMKRSLIEVRKEFEKRGMHSLIVATVHDSMVVDSPFMEKSQVISIIRDKMQGLSEHYDWITVPVKVDIGVGCDLHNLEEA